MKIIIAGSGKMGSTLTQQLAIDGYDVTVIDNNSDILEASMTNYDVMALQGNCAAMDVLKNAGVTEADLLIAATNQDETNLLCCVTAHMMNPNLHTIARIRNPEYTQQVYSMREVFGLNMAINPERQAALEVERLLKYPGFLRRDTFAKGRVEIVELRVDSKSKLKDVPMTQIGSVTGCRVLVCAVLRDGTAVTPDGSFVLRENDRIFVTASTDTLSAMLKNMGIITRNVKKVMICGGGRISYYLADRLLKSKMEVTILEKDPQRCEQLVEQLPDAVVLCGDASRQSVLESEGLKTNDALISLTGMDEQNMVISMYGASMNVPQIVTKLAHLESSGMLSSLPLGSILNPMHLACNVIIRYVRALKNQVGAALSVHTIADGQVEALEFLVDERTQHCGVPMKNLKTKADVLIATIARNGQVELVNGDSTFQNGDIVVVVTNRSNSIAKLNDVFERTDV